MLHSRHYCSARASSCALRLMTSALLALLLISFLPAVPAGAAAMNAGDELQTIHTAYAYLMMGMYEQPDATALLTAAHTAIERDLKTTLPLGPLSGDVDAQFNIFASNYQLLVAQAGKAGQAGQAGQASQAGQVSAVSLPKGTLAHDAARSMAKAVGDLHTYFLDEQASEAERRRMNGDTSIVNFGMIAMNVDGEYNVKQVVDNSPVKLAGLLPGDHVVALDDAPVNWDNHNSVLGNPQDGHTYALRVRHAHASTDTVLTVQMGRYTRDTLNVSVLDGHIGYICTHSFYPDIAQRFDEALDTLHARGVDSLLIDFRGNGGGTNVTDVLGRFLPDGTMVGRSEGRRGKLDFVAHAAMRPMETLPIVILVDETSGSASEIAALALRERVGAQLVGMKTAGAFGTARFTDLGDNTLLAITTSAYVSVNGARLNKIGITPDIIVDRSVDDMLNGVDPQMDAARGEVARLMHAPLASLPSAG